MFVSGGFLHAPPNMLETPTLRPTDDSLASENPRDPAEAAFIESRLLELRRRHLLNERRERFGLPTLDLTPDKFDFEAFDRDAFVPAAIEDTDFTDDSFED